MQVQLLHRGFRTVDNLGARVVPRSVSERQEKLELAS